MTMKAETWVAIYAAIIGTSAFLLNLKAWFDSGDRWQHHRIVASRAARPSAAQLAPFGGIRADQFGELFRRAARRLVADHGEAVLERLRCDRLVDRGVEPVDDRPRHAGGRDDAAPGRRRVTGDAGFRDRRQVRKARRAPRAADRERAHGAR